MSITEELLPLGASLERSPQEVRGHVGQLCSLSVRVDGFLQQVITALLLCKVVLSLQKHISLTQRQYTMVLECASIL